MALNIYWFLFITLHLESVQASKVALKKQLLQGCCSFRMGHRLAYFLFKFHTNLHFKSGSTRAVINAFSSHINWCDSSLSEEGVWRGSNWSTRQYLERKRNTFRRVRELGRWDQWSETKLGTGWPDLLSNRKPCLDWKCPCRWNAHSKRCTRWLGTTTNLFMMIIWSQQLLKSHGFAVTSSRVLQFLEQV